MSARRQVRFEPPANILQPSSTPVQFMFDEAASENDVNSEKSPIREREEPVWNQRPKSTPWSSRPHLLREKLRVRWWRDLLVDTFVMTVSLPFFAIVAIVIVINGREVNNEFLALLEQAIKGGATLFPIFFAYVTGRAAVKFATWKLEQGSSLGLLEQLMGSRTVASSITTQVHLRKYNLIGLGLIVLWSLSPVGSQAILYILESPFQPRLSSVDISYINTRQQSYAAPDGEFKGKWFSGFTMLFGSSLLAPPAVRTSSMDIWGNVKIPYYSSTFSLDRAVGEDGWITIPDSSTPIYSAMFGIPLSGVQLGNTTLAIESSYIQLNCTRQTFINSNRSNIVDAAVQDNERASANNLRIISTLISPQGPFLSNQNISFGAPWAIGYQGSDIAAFNESGGDSNYTWTYPKSCPDCLDENLKVTTDPGTLLYQEFDGFDNATNVFCTPSQLYVESMITCEKTDATQTCRVTAQRPSRLPHNLESVTYLSFREVVLGVSALLPNLSPLADNNPAQRYLYDSVSANDIITGAASNLGDAQSPLALKEVSLSQFSDRLGQLINTFIYASMWNTTAYTIGASFEGIVNTPLGGNAASFKSATPDEIYEMIKNQTAAFTVPAVLEKQVRIYKVSYSWAAVFIFSTSAMLFSACGGVYFSRKTVVPDYLGYVSSLAKESPHVRMPNGGANLDGMDRARLMKDLRVRLGNVDEGRGQVGRLAFARMEETGVVRKDSFYV